MAVTTSIAGCFGFPLRCGYSASKFALYGFFETLQAEYHDRGIRVTLVFLSTSPRCLPIRWIEEDSYIYKNYF